MATNLRLGPEAEEAVRAEAQRSGRSQQEVIRAAVDRYLGVSSQATPTSDLDELIATGTVRAPRTPYRRQMTRLALPADVSSADLLDRADRV